MPDFSNVIKNLPQKPGVYRYYGMNNNLLYIGKAKNLKNRVSSYFQEGRPKNQRLSLMISQIVRIEYTVVETEAESLILEANLIHNLQPKYNILLKDDKNYVYIRITDDEIPGIFLVRKKYDTKSRYFGPYTKKIGISQTLRTLRTIFPYCQERTRKSRPCSYYGIKQCDGICAGLETREEYLQKIDQICKILSGKTEEVEKYLREKIVESVNNLNYELASLYRDRLTTLVETIGDQKIILPKPQDLDIVTLIVEENQEGLQIGSVFVQSIRSGKMVNVNNFLLSGNEDTEGLDNDKDKQLVVSMLERFLSSYKAFQKDQVPIITQAFVSEK